MINTYHIDNSIRLTATFKVAGVVTDPNSSVLLNIIRPDGAEITYTYPADITKSSTGIYYKEILSDQSGEWHYQWVGTGSNIMAADESYYNIEKSKFE